MICRRKFQFLAKIASFPCKLQCFASVASPIKHPNDINPNKIFPPKVFSNQEQLKTSFLTPQIVLTTLQSRPDLDALSFFLWCARQPHYFHDRPTIHHMVNVVSKLTQRCGTVKGILGELGSVGCVTKAQTFLLLMRIYWRGAMYDMVLEAFEEMCRYGYVPDTYTRNIVMDVLFKIGNVDAALWFFKETKSPNFLSFSIAICNLCRLNEVDNVKIVLRCMLMKGLYMNPETYALVLNCFCKFGRLEEATQLLCMMMVLGAPVSVNVWSILIDGYCKSGQIEIAAYLLEKMIEIGCSPNIVTCTSLIKGFLECQMPSRAFEMLRTLELKGCFPDLVLCNVLIDCLSKMGWYEDAFEVFSSLRERKLMPDVYTYSSLVTTISLSRQFVLLPLLTSGLAIEPDLVVCNSLLSYFSKAGYPEGAVEFYNDMIERGFQPDKYSFAGVLRALCRSGRIHEAVNVYHGILRSYEGVDAHIHTIIVNGLIKSGNFPRAVKIFKKTVAEKFPLDAVSYNVAIDGLIRGGQKEEAYAMFHQMRATNLAPNQRTYNLILSSFCKDRNVNAVTHVLREMIDTDIKIDYRACKSVKKLLDICPNSYLVNLFYELINSGFLPEVEQVLVDGHDTSFNSSGDYRNRLDLSTSSSDELSDVAVSVG
ncbi:hypothetical protein ACS0TY_035565 [Phlomoides rotata]